jgi:hypothetical protein
MLFCRKMTFETRDSQGEVAEKLQQLVELEPCRKYKRFYKGEVTKEGFLLKPQIADIATNSFIWIAGKFIQISQGTQIDTDIRIYTSKKIGPLGCTAILIFMFCREFSSPRAKWLIISFLALIWFVFFYRFWTEVKTFKSTMNSLFTEPKKDKAATTSS